MEFTDLAQVLHCLSEVQHYSISLYLTPDVHSIQIVTALNVSALHYLQHEDSIPVSKTTTKLGQLLKF